MAHASKPCATAPALTAGSFDTGCGFGGVVENFQGEGAVGELDELAADVLTVFGFVGDGGEGSVPIVILAVEYVVGQPGGTGRERVWRGRRCW